MFHCPLRFFFQSGYFTSINQGVCALCRFSHLRPSLTIPAAEGYVSSEEHVFVERSTQGEIKRLTIPHPHFPPAPPRVKTVTLHYYRDADPAWATMAVGAAVRPCPLEYLTLGYRGDDVAVSSVRVKVGGLYEQGLARHVLPGGLETWRFPSPGPLVPRDGGGGASKIAVAVDITMAFSGATVPTFSCSSLTLFCARV